MVVRAYVKQPVKMLEHVYLIVVNEYTFFRFVISSSEISTKTPLAFFHTNASIHGNICFAAVLQMGFP